MKRNWITILALIALIAGYEHFVLTPYQQRYTPKETPVAVAPAAGTSTTDAGSATAKPPSANESRIKVNEAAKKSAVRLDVNTSRNFSVFKDGGIGDAVFTMFFQRGKDRQTSVRLVENGFHWRSTDVRVDNCLKTMSAKEKFVYAGAADGVTCAVKYNQNNLKLETALEVQSATAVSGDVFFETEDTVGEGPQFDHRYLATKKKDEKVEKIRDKKLWEESARTSGPYDWIAWGDKYFSVNILPKGRFNPDVYHQKGFEEAGHVQWGIAYPLKWSADNTKLNYDFDVYFAIKDLQELRSVREDLADTIDFGFFSGIARFMLWCLEMLYHYTKNYGVSIIVLSLVVRMLLWPINRKMFESGIKMKEIQPQMEAIKKRYEGKQDQLLQMNQEIRALYQKSGVNPLGSCLPLFLQIPIFFGLNSALSNSVDLYQAPFFGWIHDLSYKDPYYILPVIWTISLVISVELNPQQAPSQPGMPDMKWISRVMFVVFGFISKDFPSGLNLYFLVSNLAGMGQQSLFRKKKPTGSPANILIGKER